MSACGGGGGADSDTREASDPVSTALPSAKIVMSPGALQVTSVAGTEGAADFSAQIETTAQEYVAIAAEPQGLVSQGSGNFIDQQTLSVQTLWRGDLAPGEYRTEMLVRICKDTSCTQEFAGSPARLPVVYTVKPGLQAADSVALERSGNEEAPTQTVPVTVPAEAGTVQMNFSSYTPSVFDVSYTPGLLTVRTQQVPAGTYTGTVSLQSTTDARYQRQIPVSYEVMAPQGGERALSVSTQGNGISVQQGTSGSTRLTVQRPTWTDAWAEPTLNDNTGRFTLRKVSTDVYEVDFNGVNAAIDNFAATVRFTAGDTGGAVVQTVVASVFDNFYLDRAYGRYSVWLNENSTEAQLDLSSGVLTLDGQAAQWSATTSTPWLTLVRSSGTTGVHPLQARINKAALATMGKQTLGQISVSIDRPGTTPKSVQVEVLNDIPRMSKAVTGAVVGDTGRIYIDGTFTGFSDWLSKGLLKVTGATVTAQRMRSDPRLLSPMALLELDVSGAVPGQPLTIRIDHPLLGTQVSMPVVALPVVPTGYAALPLGQRRPGQYGPITQTWRVTGADQVHAWAHDNTQWQLTSATFTGVSDIALNNDESRVHAVSGQNVLTLTPNTLVELSRGLFVDDNQGQPDNAAPGSLSALAWAADGRAFASVNYPFGADRLGVAVWIGGRDALGNPTDDFMARVGSREIGARHLGTGNSPAGAGIARSPGGQSIVEVLANGGLNLYQTSVREWRRLGQIAAGQQVVAVDDAGQWLMRADGVLMRGDVPVGASLSSRLPSTYEAGGYGLSPDGQRALVYGYQIATEAGKPRARNAAIWVLDIGNVPNTPVESAPLLGRIDLTDAVGCTTTLSPGEACAHTASVSVAPGNRSVFVVGPRGMAAVSIPSSFDNGGVVVARERAANLKPSTTQRNWLMRAVKRP